MTLLNLAERLEQAEGADRRLDYEIMTVTVLTGHAYLWDPVDRNHRYTESLDAAVTLVPEGWAWMAGMRDPLIGSRAYVHNGQSAFVGFGARPNPDRIWHEVVAATPALALAAAALRARHALIPVGE